MDKRNGVMKAPMKSALEQVLDAGSRFTWPKSALR
jgi:hypothetical protein